MAEKIKNIIEIDADRFEAEVINKENVVLDIFSTECPPCEALAPKFEKLAIEYDGKVSFVKIFRQANRDLVMSLGVMSSPTLLFFKNGKIVGDRLLGNISESDIRMNLDSLLNTSKL